MSRFIIHMLIVILALLAGGGLLAACGGGGEELTLVRGFFTASRYQDRATLGNMSMAVFSPTEDGIATSPSIQNVTEEDRRQLRFGELQQALEDIQAAETSFRAEKKQYQDANEEAIGRVIEANREGEEVASRDEEVRDTWTQWVSDEREFARKVSDAQNALNEESRLAQASVYDPSNPINVVELDGELLSKDVTVTANVELDGASEERTMVFTMQKVELQGEAGLIEGRWIITSIE
jgi:hypothetical protein